MTIPSVGSRSSLTLRGRSDSEIPSKHNRIFTKPQLMMHQKLSLLVQFSTETLTELETFLRKKEFHNLNKFHLKNPQLNSIKIQDLPIVQLALNNKTNQV